MTGEEMRHSQRLQEKVAAKLQEGEEYAIVKAEGQPVVVSIAIPSAQDPKIVILCRSIEDYVRPFYTAEKVLSQSPEEFAIRIADDQLNSIKRIHPNTKAILLLSDYKKNRLPMRDARRIADSTDILLINEEIEKLSEILTELCH